MSTVTPAEQTPTTETTDTADTADTALLPWPKVGLLLVGGLVGGLLWGALARVWMRFISTDPEFTWDGTIFIVGAFGVVAFMQAVALAVRRRGVRRRIRTVTRVVTMGSLVAVCSGPAMPLIVTVVLAPLALTHPHWGVVARRVLLTVAVLPLGMIVFPLFADLSPLRAVVGSLWFVLVYGGVVWAATASAAPVVGQEHRVPVAYVAVPLTLALVAIAVMMTGLSG